MVARIKIPQGYSLQKQRPLFSLVSPVAMLVSIPSTQSSEKLISRDIEFQVIHGIDIMGIDSTYRRFGNG